ncbi:MAG: hypothetical protein ACI9UA_005574, partial [Pseudoalteromonas tetraodonis]
CKPGGEIQSQNHAGERDFHSLIGGQQPGRYPNPNPTVTEW